MTLTATLDQLRERAQADPALEATLRHLVEAGDVTDPFAVPPDDVRDLARRVNRRRQDERLTDVQSRSLTTRQVVDLLVSVSDRKGVDRRRARGNLLGIRLGNQVLHPAWQFDQRRGDTLPGLDQVLAALRDVTDDALDVDAIAMAPRPHTDGASIADLLADGDIDTAVALARMAGDQS